MNSFLGEQCRKNGSMLAFIQRDVSSLLPVHDYVNFVINAQENNLSRDCFATVQYENFFYVYDLNMFKTNVWLKDCAHRDDALDKTDVVNECFVTKHTCMYGRSKEKKLLLFGGGLRTIRWPE